MASTDWSDKRERQYAHIKAGLQHSGKGTKLAEEIAARTVNKERARAGESVTTSASSIDDMSSGERGGHHSHEGAGGRTYSQLYNEAKQRGVKHRSTMSKEELERALVR